MAPRVAVVDGDAAALAVAELRLSAVGFSVQTYQDGRNAETALSTTLPDAVVTDFAVPRFDGISLLIKLRRTPGGERLPVFFTSATTDRLTVTKALKLGATDVMAKPVNFDVLVAKIRDSVTTSRGSAALSKIGVRGNLAEMAITDLLQVLAFGRRTATIQLDTSRGRARSPSSRASRSPPSSGPSPAWTPSASSPRSPRGRSPSSRRRP